MKMPIHGGGGTIVGSMVSGPAGTPRLSQSKRYRTNSVVTIRAQQNISNALRNRSKTKKVSMPQFACLDKPAE